MTVNINNYSPRSGRMIRDDNTLVNEANGINNDGSQNVRSVPNDYAPVTPNDSADLPGGVTTYGLYITAAGNVSVVMENGNTRTIPVTGFMYLHGAFKRVRATGTTVPAGNIFANY